MEDHLFHEALNRTCMPLQVSKPPVAAEKAVRSMLARIVATDPGYVTGLGSASADSVAISTPHRIAILALDRIDAGMSLRSAAQKKGWRFLVHNGDKVVATINSSMSGKGNHGFSNISYGRLVAAMERAIRRAELLEPVRSGRFELLLLQVPAIHLVALWLRNLESNADLIMPIAPAPKGLRAYQAIATADFVVALAALKSQNQQEHAEALGAGMA